MRVGVWGAGEVGTALVYRLASTRFTTEIHWINRTLERIECRVIDIQQGLAFAPCCRLIKPYAMDQARPVIERLDLLVLTFGAPVSGRLKRADLYPANRDVFRDAVVPAIRGYAGIVLVVTNPVDLMTRLLLHETGLSDQKVMGLGTVVETARLRASLGSYLTPRHLARDVEAYMVGTHDEHCVVVVPEGGGRATGAGLDPEVIAHARQEVIRAAKRVKRDERSTLFPIVEGSVAVARAVAADAGDRLTVSARDPDSGADLCYSMPCSLGQSGILGRHTECLDDPGVKAGVEQCKLELEKVLRTSGEL
jgi:L-lactate dehydrogenase